MTIFASTISLPLLFPFNINIENVLFSGFSVSRNVLLQWFMFFHREDSSFSNKASVIPGFETENCEYFLTNSLACVNISRTGVLMLKTVSVDGLINVSSHRKLN